MESPRYESYLIEDIDRMLIKVEAVAGKLHCGKNEFHFASKWADAAEKTTAAKHAILVLLETYRNALINDLLPEPTDSGVAGRSADL
jgi:hypothetical protein